jgi:transposase
MSDTEFLLKSEPVRRLEVFTGSGRRRAWTTEQKAQIVAETYAGGESVSAVARRHTAYAGTVYRLVGFDTPESGSNGRCGREQGLATTATQRLR